MQEMQHLEETDIAQLLQFIFCGKNMKTSMGEKYFGIIENRIIAALQPLRWPWLNPPHKVVRVLFHRLCVSKEASFENEYIRLLRLILSTRSQARRWSVAGKCNRVVSSVQVLTDEAKYMLIRVPDYNRVITSNTTAIAVEPGRRM